MGPNMTLLVAIKEQGLFYTVGHKILDYKS